MTSVKKTPRKRTIGASRELPRREQNKLDKRERIREAAYALFRRQGFEETTVAQVAERAEVAKGTVMLYANDKDDRLCMIMHDRLQQTVNEQLTSLPRRAGLEQQLMHLFGGLFAM